MATTNQRIKGITIEFNGETKKLQDSLKKVNASITSTKSALKDVNTLLKLDPTNTALLQQKQELLAQGVKDTKNKLEEEKEALEQLKNAGDNEQTIKQQQALEREIAATTQELKNMEKQAREASSVLGSQMQAVGGKISAVGNGIADAGKNMIPLTGAVAGIGTAIVKTTADFDKAMSNVKAISGASSEEFDLLRDKAREMGAETKYSASEAADALSYMAMAGWKTEDMLAGIEGVLHLAGASNMELAETSDIVTDAMTALGISITQDNVANFVDTLAAASSNANTNVGMMGETFKYCAGTAGSLGYSIEDVSLAVGLMANSGIKASQAGTALNNIFTRMAKPTKESSAAMERLGLSLYDSQGNMYSFKDIMDQMRASFGSINMPIDEFNKSLEDLDTQLANGDITQKKYESSLEELTLQAYGAEGAEKARAAAMLAGKTGMAGLLGIVNASARDYEILSKAINKSNDAAEDMYNTMQDNLVGSMDEIKSKLQELSISLGDLMMPTIDKIVDKIGSFIDRLNEMDDSTKQTIITIALIVAAIAPVLIIVGSVVSAVGSIITSTGLIITFIQGSLIPVLAQLGGFITATVIPSIVGFVAAFWPFILIAAAIVAAIVGIIAVIKNWGTITEWFSEKWSKLAPKFDLVKNKFLELKDNAKNWGRDMIDNFINGITEKINKLKDSVSNVAETISSYLHFSVPDVGPLSKADTWMPDMIDLLSTTMDSSSKGLEPSLDRLANKISGGITSGLANQKAPIVNPSVNVTLQGDASKMFKVMRNESKGFNTRTGANAFY